MAELESAVPMIMSPTNPPPPTPPPAIPAGLTQLHSSKHFCSFHSLTHSGQPYEAGVSILVSYYRGGNGSTERLSDLPKSTQADLESWDLPAVLLRTIALLVLLGTGIKACI